jgi:hypothetical protein
MLHWTDRSVLFFFFYHISLATSDPKNEYPIASFINAVFTSLLIVKLIHKHTGPAPPE